MAKAVDSEPRFRAAHGCYVENEWRKTDRLQAINRRRPVRLRSNKRGRWILAAFVAGFIAGFATHAQGADLCRGVNIDVHLGSYHTADYADYDNANYGLGATCLRDGYSLSGGVYRNSFGRASGYITANVETEGTVRFGAAIGAAIGGYDEKVKFIAGVSASADFLGVTGRVLVGPTIEKHGVVVHFVVSKAVF